MKLALKASAFPAACPPGLRPYGPEAAGSFNPVRAKVVKSISELDRYHWGGHSVVMGRFKHEWQDRDYVLSWFGKKEGEAKRAYRHWEVGHRYCPCVTTSAISKEINRTAKT